jgi:dienelactone hydrolase
VTLEVGVLDIAESGDAVPIVLCLPRIQTPVPGICVFSGHSRHGLRDLTVDLESYQAGIAVRLAQAGFVTIAVEKVDSGYLARDPGDGTDEAPIATLRLAWGRPTRSHQLMACIAAAEVLAGHPRVDPARIGATGVSLGGWLSAETALLSDRIRAVADFGRKTRHLDPAAAAADIQGIRDWCHIHPGMLAVCDRNLVALACCPMPMLAGHGRQDSDSSVQSPASYQALFAAQYRALGCPERYEYLVHDGGDDMPAQPVIDYFHRIFAPGPLRDDRG